MINRKLEDLRIDNDLTQQQVADYLGCHREVYRRYEKGSRQLPLDYLVNLTTLYNTSADHLLGLTSNKEPYPKNKSSK